MKRVLIPVVLAALLLCGCGKETFTCGFCMDQVTEKPHKLEAWGHEYKVCQDCHEGLLALAEELN